MSDCSEVERAMDRLLSTAGLTRSRAAYSGVPVKCVWSDGVGGGRMHHLEAGDGPPLVLLHGGTGGGANWFRVIGPLAKRFRVLAPDLPGFGMSDPIGVIAPLGETAAAHLLEWMVKQELADVLIAGTSFGGLVAARLAQRTDRISRLLLLDSAGLGRAIHPVIRLVTALPIARPFMRTSRAGTAVLMRKLLTSNLSDVPSEQLDALIEYLTASGRRTGARYAAAALHRFAGASGQREVLGDEELAHLTLPVSLVWGETDRFLPVSQARHAARLLPDAVLRIVPHAGHSPNWEQPALVVEAILELADRRAHALPERRCR